MRRILSLAIIVIVALGLALAQAPTTCTVSILADSGAGSLRAHIADSTCDSIAFDPTLLPGTITLDSQLTISRDLAIEGPGADLLAISGNNTVGVFEIQAGYTVAIAGVTVRGGRATVGGGIFNAGTVTVAHSTLADNAAGLDGGGIFNAGTVTVTHSTLAGNAAGLGGGGIFNAGTLTVAHSTLAGNSAASGGGINNFGTVIIKNSLVAKSPSGGNCVGDFTAQGVNLADDDTCSGFTPVEDVRLSDLAPNGGPTETHALAPDSPALDAVTDCTLVDGTPVLTDQRGVARPQPFPDGRCDIGAFELTVDLEVDLLAFFDQAVEDGTLVGSGSGESAARRLNPLRNMLATALDLIAQGEIEDACGQLSQAYLRTDGEPQPPDFAAGDAAPTLAAMILDLMDDLGCP